MENLLGPRNLSKSLDKLGDEENKILEKKYSAPILSRMGETDLFIQASQLLISIHVITGWTIPEKEIKNVLRKQLIEHLKECYSSLNINEIEYAFRQNTSVQDWGKTMNLQLIDEVLLPYLERRLRVSDLERRIKEQPQEQKIYTDEEITNQRRQEINLKYQAMRGGKVLDIPEYLKDVIRKDFKIEDVSEFFVMKLGNGAENIYIKA